MIFATVDYLFEPIAFTCNYCKSPLLNIYVHCTVLIMLHNSAMVATAPATKPFYDAAT
jgi:hypothetical protein